MEKQNEKQIEFVKELFQTLLNAVNMSEKIITALEIGGVSQEQACYDYLKALNAFLDAGMKIIWTTHIAYGENSKTVAENTLNRTDIGDSGPC